MNPSITSKFAAFGFAAMVTLTIMVSLDALASVEQNEAAWLAAKPVMTQTACLDTGRAPRS